MPFKVVSLNYDLQQKRVSLAAQSDGPDQGYVNAGFILHVPPETPEHELRHQMEEQARQIFAAAAAFVRDPDKAPGT